jgi:hypothetical protein
LELPNTCLDESRLLGYQLRIGHIRSYELCLRFAITVKNGLHVEIFVSGANLKPNARGRGEIKEQLSIPENAMNEIRRGMVQYDYLYLSPEALFQVLFQGQRKPVKSPGRRVGI